MRGHIRRRGKSWCFVIEVGRDPETGKRQQRWKSGFDTREASEQALNKALGKLDAGADPFPSDITVSALVDRWLQHCATQDEPRYRTRARYEQLLRKDCLDMIGGHRLDRIRVAHCQAVLDAATGRGLKPRTVAQLRAAMSSAFEFAVRGGLIVVNPVRSTRNPTPAKPVLRVPDAAELLALIDAARATVWEIRVLIAATTGARRAEVLGLRWAGVDLDQGRVRVLRSEATERNDGDPLGDRPQRLRWSAGLHEVCTGPRALTPA
jgi:integrase